MSLEKLLHKMEQDAFDRGKAEGIEQARAIKLCDAFEKATACVLLEDVSFMGLRRQIRTRRYRREGDNPGQAFLWTCEPIWVRRPFSSDGLIQALVICAIHYDV